MRERQHEAGRPRGSGRSADNRLLTVLGKHTRHPVSHLLPPLAPRRNILDGPDSGPEHVVSFDRGGKVGEAWLTQKLRRHPLCQAEQVVLHRILDARLGGACIQGG